MSDYHVRPLDDLLEHVQQDCPCLPETLAVEREDGSYAWLIVHNAWDGRE